MFLLIRPIRLLLKAFLAENDGRAMAWGLALGIMLGLVPKGNLLAVALGIFVACLRVNLGVTAASVAGCSLLGGLLDPLTHRIGQYLLTHESLIGMWTRLYNTPGMPWTDFNNTVVIGSLALGLLLIIPVRLGSRPFFDRYTAHAAKYAQRFWLTRVLLGAEWANKFGAVG